LCVFGDIVDSSRRLYYCVLNPIELIWSQLKHGVRKSNLTPGLGSSVIELIRHRTAKIYCVLWRNCVRHTIDVENSFQSSQPYPGIIIHLKTNPYCGIGAVKHAFEVPLK
jgi:hypothetical protein